jgi:hypothetical protein
MTKEYLESLETYRLKNRRPYVAYAFEETKIERFRIELENIDKILKKRENV